jgi:hypothetical protein
MKMKEFKFELNLKEDEGVIVDDSRGFFKNPTFETIAEFSKKNYGYKEVNQLEDIILPSHKNTISANVEVVYEDGFKRTCEIYIDKYPIIS